MTEKKYISFNNLSKFFDNIKSVFATKTEVNAKSDKNHTHSISDISGLQTELNGKAPSSHGNHVTYSTSTPAMDGAASAGSASTVARSDHKHPTDTSRAAQTSLDTHTSNTTVHITSTERANWNTAYNHSQSTHAPSNAEKNQNAFSYVKVGSTSVAADTATDTLTLVAGSNVTLTPNANDDSVTISSTDTNTTYSAGTGISLSGTTFSNSGVRSISTGSSNGTISVNTNGTSVNVAVKGLGSAAYTASTDYDATGTAKIKADEALVSAKAYTDSVKSDLLNGAGAAYDTLKELGDLIDENVDAIDALEKVAASKANTSDVTSHTSNKSNPHSVTLAQLGVTATVSELNKMDGITATTAELNIMDGVTATTAELNYVDGVTSNIQNQLDGKAASSHTHKVSNISDLTATATELNYMDGVKSNVQTQLDGKAASSHNHSASNITSGILSSDRLPTVPIEKGGTGATTASGILTNLGISASATELSYVDGTTSNIQNQLNNKAASSHTHNYLPLSGGNLTGTLGIGNKYELSPAYNFTNGCLIDIGTAKSSTMVSIHITGNSYSATALPINSLFQFYDYGDGIIMNCSGVNLGLPLGAMTTYRYNNRLYAHIKQTASYQTLSFTIMTNKSGLSPTVENAAAHTSGYTDLVTITPKNVSFDGHTHKYAGSSSAGGVANSAIKATQDASGNVITSTYATKTELDTAKSNLQTSINSKANSSHTHAISDVTNLQSTLDGKSNTSHTHSYAGSSSVGGSATSAVKLDTSTAGDSNTPVYFTNGKPVACTSLDLNTSGSSASCTGNSATATKLQTARTIGLGTGATGTATSFNGTANITIPVTDVKESYLSWGGRNISGGVSPVDAACSNIHSANRFTFAKPAGITIEYSTNGSTYSAYSTTDSAKINLVSGIGSAYYIGARSSSTTVNDKLRITLNATNMGLYTRLRKLLINITTNYSTGSNVIIEKSMKGSETTFKSVGTYQISGWSGWNSIPIEAAFGGGDTQTSNIANLRLTFGITGINSAQTSNALTVFDIIGIGDTYWSYPSTMAKTGHIYNYDSSQNATFPANVTANTFVGALSGNATTASTCSGNSATATKLSSAKTISLTGDVTGSTSFDGSGNVSITATIADDSHNHIISNVDGLQSALDGKSATSHNHNSAYISKSLQFTSDSGAQKLSYYKDDGKNILTEIAALTTGFYTMYSQSGTAGNPKTTEAWRFMIHKTGNTTGWVQGYGSLGSVYTNYQDGDSGWRGWKCIWDNSPAPLWSGAMYMSSPNSIPQTVKPTKKLSECRTGWMLLWSDYDAGSGSNDADFATTMIPKLNPSGGKWGGKSFLCDIPRYVGSNAEDVDTERRIIKVIYVHDDRIEGSYQGDKDERNDVVLRAVYEF